MLNEDADVSLETIRPAGEPPIPRLFVVGASLGGVAALSDLVADLPIAFPAPVLVVLHADDHPGILPDILSSRGALPARHAVDGEALLPGQIYLAPPDRHMSVEVGRLRLTCGPKEHHTRPAIDPLFLSAALTYGQAVVGILLSGDGEDGTAGLRAIKGCGGTTIVQEPTESLAPNMAESALQFVPIDYRSRVAAMGKLLQKLADEPVSGPQSPRPERLVHEMKLHSGQGDPVEHLQAIAQPSPFVCPDCKGGLWQIDGSRPVRYRCHTGHAFTLATLQQALAETKDEALWTAVRALQEQTVLLAMLAIAHRSTGHIKEAMELDLVREGIERQCQQLNTMVRQDPVANAFT